MQSPYVTIGEVLPCRAVVDERDHAIAAARLDKRRKLKGPLVGDILRVNGKSRRISHHWGDSVQWSEGGSWYLCEGGGGSFSGGLEPGLPIEEIHATSDESTGVFWFFHHERPAAHSGVQCTIQVRVWEHKPTDGREVLSTRELLERKGVHL